MSDKLITEGMTLYEIAAEKDRLAKELFPNDWVCKAIERSLTELIALKALREIPQMRSSFPSSSSFFVGDLIDKAPPQKKEAPKEVLNEVPKAFVAAVLGGIRFVDVPEGSRFWLRVFIAGKSEFLDCLPTELPKLLDVKAFEDSFSSLQLLAEDLYFFPVDIVALIGVDDSSNLWIYYKCVCVKLPSWDLDTEQGQEAACKYFDSLPLFSD